MKKMHSASILNKCAGVESIYEKKISEECGTLCAKMLGRFLRIAKGLQEFVHVSLIFAYPLAVIKNHRTSAVHLKKTSLSYIQIHIA